MSDIRKALEARLQAWQDLAEWANGGWNLPAAATEKLRKLCAEARAALAQPQAAQPGEVAWLIEWKDGGQGPQWWGFSHSPGVRANWCHDPNKAIRFSRREDAERMRKHVIAVAGLTGHAAYERCVSVTEHMWPAAPPTEPAPQAEPMSECPHGVPHRWACKHCDWGEPAPSPQLSPTHYCTICGANWRQCDDGSWNLRSKTCGKCCDCAPMGDQIQPLSRPAQPAPQAEPAVKDKP